MCWFLIHGKHSELQLDEPTLSSVVDAEGDDDIYSVAVLLNRHWNYDMDE